MILCDKKCAALPQPPRSIAYADLKDRRARFPVAVGPKGCLGDYVPFYYAPRSPMLYVNWRGGAGSDGQAKIIHLVACAETVAADRPTVITDGHAATPLSLQYDTFAGLNEIDWDCMGIPMWTDTDAHGDRKRRRQAEFLAHDSVPFDAVRTIGVMTDEVHATVESILSTTRHQPPVRVRRDWYY